MELLFVKIVIESFIENMGQEKMIKNNYAHF